MSRTTVRNPNTGRDDGTIDTAYYEAVRRAILDALAEHTEIAFGELRAHVEERTDPTLWEDASVGWYTTTVKLDLEARGLLERSGTPQILRLTPTGVDARSRTDPVER